eukprot:1159460-Pelagomonas_calceolata.AAC.1
MAAYLTSMESAGADYLQGAPCSSSSTANIHCHLQTAIFVCPWGLLAAASCLGRRDLHNAAKTINKELLSTHCISVDVAIIKHPCRIGDVPAFPIGEPTMPPIHSFFLQLLRSAPLRLPSRLSVMNVRMTYHERYQRELQEANTPVLCGHLGWWSAGHALKQHRTLLPSLVSYLIIRLQGYNGI